MVRNEGEHYSTCLMNMLYNRAECQCAYIDSLLSGRSKKTYYADEIAGESEEQ